MRTLRLLVVVLLALLLPLHGVLAMSATCLASRATAAPGQVDTVHSAHGDFRDVAAAETPCHEVKPARSVTCSTCAGLCCVACMTGPELRLQARAAPLTTAYPPLAVPTPHFQSGGPDRPPRSA